MLKLKRAGRLGTWGGGFGDLRTSFSRERGLFEGQKLQGGARRKRKFQGRSFRQGSNFYFMQLAEAMRFLPPFFSALSHAHCTPRLVPSRLVVKKEGERKEL